MSDITTPEELWQWAFTKLVNSVWPNVYYVNHNYNAIELFKKHGRSWYEGEGLYLETPHGMETILVRGATVFVDGDTCIKVGLAKVQPSHTDSRLRPQKLSSITRLLKVMVVVSGLLVIGMILFMIKLLMS